MKKIILSSLLVSIISLNAFGKAWDGDDITVTATKVLQEFDIHGRSGENGSDGYDGSNGSCDEDGCSKGGDGGDGGDGESGGNGGNIYVIFKDLEDVKNIFVNAVGGRGGSGGRGGDGGSGSPAGTPGDSGSPGQSGYWGFLYLVPEIAAPLRYDNSNSRPSIKELLDGEVLTKRIWGEYQGADELLAKGSIIDPLYYHLEGYEYGYVNVVLNDPTKISPKVLEEQCKTTYKDGVSNIALDYHVGIYEQVKNGDSATMFIERLYNTNEFNSLAFEKLAGKSGSRKILLNTSVDLVPRPKLSLTVKVERKKNIFKWETLFVEFVPQELIETRAGGYTVDFEKLSKGKFIASDDKLRITLTHQLAEMSIKSSEETETWTVRAE